MEERTYLRGYKRREIRIKILDWLSLFCLGGAIVSFTLELIYGGELFANQTLGFITGWLAINEIRMRERFNDMKELMDTRLNSLEKKMEAMEKGD